MFNRPVLSPLPKKPQNISKMALEKKKVFIVQDFWDFMFRLVGENGGTGAWRTAALNEMATGWHCCSTHGWSERLYQEMAPRLWKPKFPGKLEDLTTVISLWFLFNKVVINSCHNINSPLLSPEDIFYFTPSWGLSFCQIQEWGFGSSSQVHASELGIWWVQNVEMRIPDLKDFITM